MSDVTNNVARKLDETTVFEKAHKLRYLLHGVQLTRRDTNELLNALDIQSVEKLFHNNPVLNEGIPKELRETNESYDTDKYLSVMELLQKTASTLLTAEKLLLRLGVHHVRLETGTRLPQVVEETDQGSTKTSAQVPPSP